MGERWFIAVAAALALLFVVRIVFGQYVLRPALKRGDFNEHRRRLVPFLVISVPGIFAVAAACVVGLITWSFTALARSLFVALIVICLAAVAWMAIFTIRERRNRQRQ